VKLSVLISEFAPRLVPMSAKIRKATLNLIYSSVVLRCLCQDFSEHPKLSGWRKLLMAPKALRRSVPNDVQDAGEVHRDIGEAKSTQDFRFMLRKVLRSHSGTSQ
jgi:hypothetical protein